MMYLCLLLAHSRAITFATTGVFWVGLKSWVGFVLCSERRIPAKQACRCAGDLLTHHSIQELCSTQRPCFWLLTCHVVQADMAKTQLDAEKLRMEDDRERDRMAQDLAIKAAELLAKTGVQLDLNAIKREQQMPRMPFVPNQTAGF